MVLLKLIEMTLQGRGLRCSPLLLILAIMCGSDIGVMMILYSLCLMIDVEMEGGMIYSQPQQRA